MKTIIIFMTALAFFTPAKNSAQLNIEAGAKLNIQGPAVVNVTGDVKSAASILGTGTLVMNGTALQQLQTSTLAIPNLTIKNPSNIKLTGNIRVNGTLNFTSGKIIADNYSVFLGEAAVVTGAGTGKFIETTGSGQLRKLVNANTSNYTLPIGSGTNYTPVTVTISGSYSSAYVAVKTKPAIHPNKPASVTNYLNTYWIVLRSGITGPVNATATYTTSNIVGNEALYKGFYWTGTNWTKTGVTINTTTNQVTAPIAGTGGDIYAMNDFAAASASQVEAISEGNLFPNPTKAKSNISFNVESGGLINISVFDVNGRLLQSKQLNIRPGYQQHEVDLSSYKPGVYEVRLTAGQLVKNYKLVKQ